MPSPAPAAVRGGVLRWPGGELDLRSAQVRRGGRGLALDRSSYEVLLALLLRAGQVLSKDELLDIAWPGRVVSENSLAKAISRLRRELGDDAGAPLQSVHGYGYRWSGDVQWFEPERPAVPTGDGVREEQWLGADVPKRPGWVFRRVLGRGRHSLVMLAESAHGEPPRALKFGIDEEGLRDIRREVTLHRYLGTIDRAIPGLAPALGWQLDDPPVFVEYPFFEEGDLSRWMARRTMAGGLSREHRLAMVAQLAETLAELHAAGVVHQDLKPGNIFVRADSTLAEGWRIALADLGGGHASHFPHAPDVGDALEGWDDQARSERARSGAAMYCAPEVLAGGLPTQRSDAYALGVILYQMLVGDLRRPLAPGWEADIDDPLLRDDIRSLAALRPEDRSVGASQLVQNLRTLDERRRVASEKEAARQREQDAANQLRRQQLRFRLLGAASAALFAGLAVASWTGWLAWESRRSEQVRREEAQAVLDFLTDDVLTRADPYRGGRRDMLLREALQDASERIDERLAGKPRVAAAVHGAVAQAYDAWGEYAKAADHQRLAIARTLESAKDEASAPVAGMQRRLCHFERLAGRLEAAQEACDAATSIDLRLAGAVSDESAVENAKLGFERGRCTEVLETLQPLVEVEGGRMRLPIDLEAEAHGFIGLCQARLGTDGPATESFRMLVRLREAEVGPEHPKTAWALADFAEALARAGRFIEATEILGRMEQIFEARLGPDHPDAFAVAFRRGLIALGQGLDAEAASWFENAYRGWSRSLGERHLSTLLAGSEYARALARTGRIAEASALVARLRLSGTEVLAGREGRGADVHELWAETLVLLGRTNEASEELAAFRQSAETILPSQHPRLAMARCLDSRIAARRGETERAGVALSACRMGLARLAPDDYRRRALVDAERAMDNIGA